MPSESFRRVAALYDVHGNLPALEAAIAAAEEAEVDLFVLGGDLALGPMPREVMDRLADLGPRMRCLRGNCDRLMVDAFDGRILPALPEAVREAVAALPDRQRWAVTLHHLGGLSWAEVALVVGGTEAAARRAGSDGVAALRRTGGWR